MALTHDQLMAMPLAQRVEAINNEPYEQASQAYYKELGNEVKVAFKGLGLLVLALSVVIIFVGTILFSIFHQAL